MKQIALLLLVALWGSGSSAGELPNILFISVDDMSCDSVGAFGCELPQTTPHIDALAAQGLRFKHAHVQVGNCMPSRNVMFSGRYPHNNRVEGFYQVRDPDYPVLCDLMKDAGYFTGIRGKVSHSTPYNPYAWDIVLDTNDDGKFHTKDVESYFTSTKMGIAASRAANKPFCLLINVSDPHKPFYATGKGGETVPDPYIPSRVFSADEVPVPKFLPDHPEVRRELAQYYSTVRRADDCVGKVLQALDESGLEDETAVFFLSDHGMPLPFAKTALYHHSTRTPWIVRWPGVTVKDTIDERHMISAVDLLPTLLDVAGIDHPSGLDGRSFLPLLKGETQAGRDMIFKEYNENSGGVRNPMRGIQTRRFGYLYNPWSNGERFFRTATTGTITYRTMKRLAETDEAIAARVKLFDLRVPEEFYDYENDPDALHNLIDDPDYQDEIQAHRAALQDWMERTGDHALESFLHRDDPQVAEAYTQRVQQESAERRQRKRARQQGQIPNRQPNRRNVKLIRMVAPGASATDGSVSVTIKHMLPNDIGEQLLHVTLKNGKTQKRIERKVVTAQGAGKLTVSFDLPESNTVDSVTFAAFVGKDYQHNLQHVTSGKVALR